MAVHLHCRVGLTTGRVEQLRAPVGVINEGGVLRSLSAGILVTVDVLFGELSALVLGVIQCLTALEVRLSR